MVKKNLCPLFCLLFVFAHFINHAQNQKQIDSINVLVELSKKHIYDDTKLSITYLKKAENLSNNQNSPKLQGRIFYDFGNAYYMTTDYDLSLEYFLKSKDIFVKVKDSVGILKCYTGLGLVEMGIDNYENSIDYYKKAGEYIKSPIDEKQSVIDFNIGLNYFYLKKYDSAKVFFLKSSKVA